MNNNETQPTLGNANLSTSGHLVFANLGIDLTSCKFTQLSRLKRAHYRAVKNWLTKHRPNTDASNLEMVRGYLEAFHHLCEVKAWEEASTILFTHLNTPTNEQLHNQLYTWGYYSDF